MDSPVEGLPHARGGVSTHESGPGSPARSSPRPWGCFYGLVNIRREEWVFPTPVGVFLLVVTYAQVVDCLPHARGGVSRICPLSQTLDLSSPRPWGCFWWIWAITTRFQVFPTPVGVFLHSALRAHPPSGLPHARGGVSHCIKLWSVQCRSSPRPWGCFSEVAGWPAVPRVFPTPVGVFPAEGSPVQLLWRLPHARGGVSIGH